MAADLAVAAIGLQDAVRGALEQQQRLLFVRVQPLERAVEAGKGITLGEAGVEVSRQRRSQHWNGMAPIGLELGLELPDLAAHARLVLALLLVERGDLVHQSLGVDPAQDMEQDDELSYAVADDGQLERDALRDESAEPCPQRLRCADGARPRSRGHRDAHPGRRTP